MKFIKITMLLIACASMFSCGNRKQQAPPNPVTAVQPDLPPPPPDVSVTYVGVVELDESCGHIIRVKMDDKEISFAPLNLEEVYKKPGMRVRFSINHKLDESKKCATHYQITLERITPLRN
jgi:hypothetical protein